MYYRETALTARSTRITRDRALAALTAACSRARLGPSVSTPGILISIPPAATRQEGNLVETVSKSQSPVTCHFLDGFIIAFHVCGVRKKPSFARLKGLRGFPADGNTILCKRWQQREILFQLIIRSIKWKQLHLLGCGGTFKHKLKQAVGNPRFGPGVAQAQILGAVVYRASLMPHAGVS